MNLLFILDLIGTAAFAASGAWAGVRRGMDLFGVLVLGMVTAIGGGTLRDLLLGDLPPFCLQNEIYLWLPVVTALLVFFARRYLPQIESPLLYFDAIGQNFQRIAAIGRRDSAYQAPLSSSGSSRG